MLGSCSAAAGAGRLSSSWTSDEVARILDRQARLEHALRRVVNTSGRAFIERRLTETQAEEARARNPLGDTASGPEGRSRSTSGPR